MPPLPFNKLPPLHALAAFEAVARLKSFSGAAAELCVTHGAVSHRITTLEKHFGVRLFVRRGGAVILTTKGAYFLGAVIDALSTSRSYYAVRSPHAAARTEVDSFIEWLVASSKQTVTANGATRAQARPEHA